MKTHWLDLDFGLTQFYEYSKDEQEGYTKHTTTSGNVSYRKYFNKGVFGILQSVNVLDTNFGQKLAVRVMLDEDIYVMKFPLTSDKGLFDNRFGEPLICLLPNLVKNGAYRFFPYAMEGTPKEGQQPKTFYGVSVKTANLDTLEAIDKVEPAWVRGKRDEPVAANHIPALVFKTKLGKLLPTASSVEVKEDFLEALLTKEIERLGYVANSETPAASAPAPAPKAPATSTKVNPAAKPIAAQPKVEANDTYEDVEDDDLPF